MHISDTTRLRHDLRTHVNHILGYSQLLLEDAVDDPSSAALATAVRQVAGLGKDLLKAIERLLPASLTRVTEECIRDLRTGISEPLRNLRRIIDEIPVVLNSPQYADVNKMAQASNKLLAFVEAESLESNVIRQEATQSENEREALHVLVISEDALSRNLLSHMLPALKFRVSLACNREEAAIFIQQRVFDLILLEIGHHRPLMHILEPAVTPVIIVCENADRDTAQHCVEMGAEDYVTKPLERLSLSCRIDAAFARRKQKNSAAIGKSTLLPKGSGCCAAITASLKSVLSSTLAVAELSAYLRQAIPDGNQHLTDLLDDLSTSCSAISENATIACGIAEKVQAQPMPQRAS